MRNHIVEEATCSKLRDVNGGSKSGSNLSFLSLQRRKSEAVMKSKFAACHKLEGSSPILQLVKNRASKLPSTQQSEVDLKTLTLTETIINFL